MANRKANGVPPDQQRHNARVVEPEVLPESPLPLVRDAYNFPYIPYIPLTPFLCFSILSLLSECGLPNLATLLPLQVLDCDAASRPFRGEVKRPGTNI